MSAANMRRGREWENDVAAYLNDAGWTVERRSRRGVHDAGDIVGLPGWMLECRNRARIALWDWMDELPSKIANAGARWGAVVLKRRRRSTGEAAVIMPLSAFVELIRER